MSFYHRCRFPKKAVVDARSAHVSSTSAFTSAFTACRGVRGRARVSSASVVSYHYRLPPAYDRWRRAPLSLPGSSALGVCIPDARARWFGGMWKSLALIKSSNHGCGYPFAFAFLPQTLAPPRLLVFVILCSQQPNSNGVSRPPPSLPA